MHREGPHALAAAGVPEARERAVPRAPTPTMGLDEGPIQRILVELKPHLKITLSHGLLGLGEPVKHGPPAIGVRHVCSWHRLDRVDAERRALLLLSFVTHLSARLPVFVQFINPAGACLDLCLKLGEFSSWL